MYPPCHVSTGSPISSWNATKRDICMYNVDVRFGNGSESYMRHTCMDVFLSSDASRNSSSTPCFSGTTWLYTYANRCEKMSKDLRLSPRAGAEEDKCASRIVQQYVEVDDLWGFMASDQHDPCGWPFVECVPDCSLPSNPASRGWWVNPTDNAVYDRENGNLVRCVGDKCPSGPVPDSNVMKDPRIANQIAAM
jgi:hypothetical protein